MNSLMSSKQKNPPVSRMRRNLSFTVFSIMALSLKKVSGFLLVRATAITRLVRYLPAGPATEIFGIVLGGQSIVDAIAVIGAMLLPAVLRLE
jgi:hypothetical protein